VLEADAGDRCRGARERHRHEKARRRGARTDHDEACDQRADERADTLAGARRHVRGHELPRRLREGREKRALDRPDERAGARDERREHLHGRDRSVHAHRNRREHCARATNDVDRSEDAVAP
jgi:hypothetical protein